MSNLVGNLYTSMQECYERVADVMSELYRIEQEIHDRISSAYILPEDVTLIVDAGEIFIYSHSKLGADLHRRHDLEEKVLKFLEEA